ncbi:unnamed protein product [Nezara viridula]|uniref:Uncharacterized protein n=1 Tax=Nezara viridula TaxID=85310 RepID=A0A9P0E1I7_NEZVI|nr:unnamed protein product [Nezara viridula]
MAAFLIRPLPIIFRYLVARVTRASKPRRPLLYFASDLGIKGPHLRCLYICSSCYLPPSSSVFAENSSPILPRKKKRVSDRIIRIESRERLVSN